MPGRSNWPAGANAYHLAESGGRFRAPPGRARRQYPASKTGRCCGCDISELVTVTVRVHWHTESSDASCPVSLAQWAGDSGPGAASQPGPLPGLPGPGMAVACAREPERRSALPPNTQDRPGGANAHHLAESGGRVRRAELSRGARAPFKFG